MRSVAFLSHFQAINCGKPTVPEHGSVVGESTRYPNTITYSCEDGYEIEGPSLRSCQANGTWSGNEAETRCKRKYQYRVIFILVCDIKISTQLGRSYCGGKIFEKPTGF